jgi:hypothetical protein
LGLAHCSQLLFAIINYEQDVSRGLLALIRKDLRSNSRLAIIAAFASSVSVMALMVVKVNNASTMMISGVSVGDQRLKKVLEVFQ